MKTLFEKLKNLVKLNEISLDSVSLQSIEHYTDLLLERNKQINLISRQDADKIIERHIIPCILFSTLFKGFNGFVLDIGTGGGLPGVVFAIVNQNCRITLLDSIKKKIDAVTEIIQNIGLDNIETIWTRVEDKDFIKMYSNKYDLIISRATANLTTLINYSKPLLKNENSILATMKGGEQLDEEIELAKKRFNYIAYQKIPLIYLPENPNNINQKFAVIVEKIYGRKQKSL